MEKTAVAMTVEPESCLIW